MKFRRYFVQFIVWEGIPSSLPFVTDVVPKSRASEGGMGITCVEYRALICLPCGRQQPNSFVSLQIITERTRYYLTANIYYE